MTNQLTEYFDALERLKQGKPAKIPKGTKITNDAVALEAGRGKGSIKKSRPIFAGLIQAIETAAIEQVLGPQQEKARLDMAKRSSDRYRSELDAALAREVSLLYEVYELKKQLAQVTGGSVIPIRGSARIESD